MGFASLCGTLECRGFEECLLWGGQASTKRVPHVQGVLGIGKKTLVMCLLAINPHFYVF